MGIPKNKQKYIYTKYNHKKMRTSLRRSYIGSAAVDAENNTDSTEVTKSVGTSKGTVFIVDKENQQLRNSTYTRTSSYRHEPVRTVFAPIHKVEEVCFEQPVRSYSSTVKSSYVHPITQYVEQPCYENIYTHPQTYCVEQPRYTTYYGGYRYDGHLVNSGKSGVEEKSKQPKPVSVKPKAKKSSNWFGCF